jgi:hypothetical protein
MGAFTGWRVTGRELGSGMRRPFSLAFEIPSGVVLIVTAVQTALRHHWPVAWMICIGIGLLLMGILVAFHGLRKDRDTKVKRLNDEITRLWNAPVLVQHAATPRALFTIVTAPKGDVAFVEAGMFSATYEPPSPAVILHVD